MSERVPVLFGEVLYDCFEDGSRVLGGAPFNVAWHLRALGVAPLLISRVGDDALGRKVRDVMQHWGMSTAGLQKDSAHPTGEVRVSLRGGQPSFEILPERAYDHIQADALPPMSPALIYHGSLAVRQADSANSLERLVERHPAPIFMDVNLRPPWWDGARVGRLLERARWAKLNHQELMLLVDEGGDLLEKARILQQRHGLDWVIVTQGEQGAFLLDRDGDMHATRPGPAVQVVDSVGAGDAFAAVCILGLLRHWSPQEIMPRAQEFASLLVGRRGAIIDDPALYRPLREAW